MKARVGLAAVCFIFGAASTMAEDAIKLFKLITPKDEVVIGLTSADVRALGSGPELDNFAKHLVAEGQMTVWQYAVRKDQSGNLQQAPLRRIAVFKTDTLRIENYTTPLAIVPPDK